MFRHEGFTENKVVRGGVLATTVAGLLAIGGCAEKGSSSPTGTPSTPVEQTGDQPARPDLIFDYRGGGSRIIEVYPGPDDLGPDRVSNGTYRDGDHAPAICKTVGRVVTANEAAGETPGSSNQWFEIEGSPGQRQFATALYTANAQDVAAKVPDC